MNQPVQTFQLTQERFDRLMDFLHELGFSKEEGKANDAKIIAEDLYLQSTNNPSDVSPKTKIIITKKHIDKEKYLKQYALLPKNDINAKYRM